MLATLVSVVKKIIIKAGMRRSWTAEQEARNNVSHFVKAFIMFLGSPYWAREGLSVVCYAVYVSAVQQSNMWRSPSRAGSVSGPQTSISAKPCAIADFLKLIQISLACIAPMFKCV